MDTVSDELTVTGKVDPAQIKSRLMEKTKKKVEIISSQSEEDGDGGNKKANEKSDEKPAKENKAKESRVVLKSSLDCECCISKIQKIIREIDGVNSVEVDEANGLVTVKGTMEVQGLAPYVKDKFKRDVEVVVPPENEKDKKHKEGSDKEKEREKESESGEVKSWHPPSIFNSPTSSRPTTPNGSTSDTYGLQRPMNRPESPLHVSPDEVAGVIAILKDRSVDELRKLLSDNNAYRQFLHSLDQVKIQNDIRGELREETLQLARDNLEKESRIMELRNQCKIIRTTELAAAQEKFSELDRQKWDILSSCSPASLVHGLQDAMNKAEEECENLHRQLLDCEVDLGAFLRKYKKLRTTYHRRALIHLAAKTSLIA